MEDRIDIVVTDRIAPSIEGKLFNIAAAAELCDDALIKLRVAVGELQNPFRMINVVLRRTPRFLREVTAETQSLNKALYTYEQRTRRTTTSVRKFTSALKSNSTAAAANSNTLVMRRRGATAGAAAAAASTPAALATTAAAMKKTESAAVSLGGVLRGMFLTYFAFAAAERILTLADSFTELSNKMRIVTAEGETTSEALQKVFAVAQRSRTSLDATVTLYQRLSLAMRHLNVTADEVAEVVETVSKALIAGGATAQETTSAVRQLSQAFNKGKADGDEFRSMMENAPLLMDLVAAEMGLARHELLGLAEQGKITAEVMFNAFSDVSAVQQDFSKVNLTLGQSVTRLNNSLTMMLGKINEASNATSTLAQIIDQFAKNIEVALPLAVAAIAGLIGATVPAAAVFTGIVAKVSLLGAALIATAKLAIEFYNSLTGNDFNLTQVFGFLMESIYSIDRAIKSVVDKARSLGDEFAKISGLAFFSWLERNERGGGLALDSTSQMQQMIANSRSQEESDPFALAESKYGKEVADMMRWNKERERMTVSVENALVPTARLQEVQKRLNAAKEAGYEVGAKFRELVERQVLVDERAAHMNSLLASEYDKQQGSVQQLSDRVEALHLLYTETGVEAYRREMESVNDELEKQRKILHMTSQEYASYLAKLAEEERLTKLRETVISRTTGARRDLLDMMRITREEMAKDMANVRIYAKLLQSLQSQLEALSSLEEDSTKSPRRSRGSSTSGEIGPYAVAYTQRLAAVRDMSQELRGEQDALNELFRQGALSTETYRQQTAAVTAEIMRLNIRTKEGATLVDSWNLAFATLAAELPVITEEIAYVWTDAMQRMADGTGALIAEWAVFRESMSFIDMFRQVVAQMIEALVSLTAQYMMVGIARQFAGFFAPEPTLTTGASNGLAQEPALPFLDMDTFAGGGFTGYGSTSSPAGVVHGQEFVVNAQATARNRGALEAMNAGHSMMPNIVINNNSSASVRVDSVSPDEIRLIAEDVVTKRAGSVVAREIVNPNSNVSRSLRKSTTARRRGA
jgi:tape measure domain-containing protein